MEVQLWDATAMDKLPTKEDLDELPTRRPIIVYSLDGHIALANSRALAIAGIDASTADPPGGEIRRGRGQGADRDPARRRDRPRGVEDPAADAGAGRRRARRRLRADGRGRDHDLPARLRRASASWPRWRRSPTAARCPCARTSRCGSRPRRPPTRRRCSPGSRTCARPTRRPRRRDRQPEAVLRRRDRVPDPDRGAARSPTG